MSLPLFLRPSVCSAPGADFIGLLLLLIPPPVPGSEKFKMLDGLDRVEAREEDCPLDGPLLGFFRRVVDFVLADEVESPSKPEPTCWFVLFSDVDFLGESVVEDELARLDPLTFSDLRREGESRGGVSMPIEGRRSLDLVIFC